jgi:phage baseplate assembly protein gpV
MKHFCRLLLFSLLSYPSFSMANQYQLPVHLDYRLIKQALTTQLYKGADHTAELWHDRRGCSFLKLSNPAVSGQAGQIKLLNDVHARIGTALGGQCLTVLEWGGVLETLQKPTLSADHRVLSLPVSQASAYDHQGHQLTIDKLQDLIKRVAEPKLAEARLDLNQSRDDIERTVADYLPKEKAHEVNKILNTLKIDGASAGSDGIDIKLSFEAAGKGNAKKPEAPLTEAEQKQWQANWQEWDAMLSKAIQQASDDAQAPEVRDTLMEILTESRAAFHAGLKDHDSSAGDPVRLFFTHTWERLAPVLRTIAKDLPEIQGLRYMTFIAATDVIYELENIGAPFGLDISSDGLRRLARLLMAGKEQRAELD